MAIATAAAPTMIPLPNFFLLIEFFLRRLHQPITSARLTTPLRDSYLASFSPCDDGCFRYTPPALHTEDFPHDSFFFSKRYAEESSVGLGPTERAYRLSPITPLI